MYIRRLQLEPYGAFSSLEIELGEGLTVVVGANEAGKSTALRALTDLIFGIPRQTDMAHSFVRKELTVMAQVTIGSDVVEIQRTAEGLSSGTKQLPSPWGVDGVEPTDGGAWWLARFGIDHTRLRRGGREVMNGGGDIGELIFAATEGTSARQMRQTVEEEANKIWKPRGQKLRLSEAVNTFRETKDRVAERQARSAQVAQLEREVTEAAKALAVAEQELLDADRGQKRSEEDSRAIRHTLKYLAAQVELTKIDGEGPRVDAQQLEQWDKARQDVDKNASESKVLTGEINKLEQGLVALPDRPELLADGEAIKGLVADFPVARDALKRAREQHDPKIDELGDRLRRLLARVRVTAEDIDVALEQVLVDAERRAELNDQVRDLASYREHCERSQGDVSEAIGVLAERALVIDTDEAEAVDTQALKEARQQVRNAEDKLKEVGNRISNLREKEDEHNAAAMVAPFEPRFGEHELQEARDARDGAWAGVRRAWLTEEPTDKANRLAMADEFDAAQRNADEISDQVADDRTEQVRQQTRGEMLNELLIGIRKDIDEKSKALKEAEADRRQAMQRWIDSWAPARLNARPDFDDLEAVVPAIAKIINARRDLANVKAEIHAAEQKWVQTCRQFGLSEQMTPSMWTERESSLSDIDMATAERDKERRASAREMQRWGDYLRRLRPMVEKHEIDWPKDPDVDAVSAAVDTLSKAAESAIADERERKSLRVKLKEKQTEKAGVDGNLHQAQVTINAIRATYGDPDEQEMGELIDRGRRAIKQELVRDEAARDLQNALNPGSQIEEVVERLRDEDEASVQLNLDKCHEARSTAKAIRDKAFEESRARQQELDEITGRGGAVEALAKLERNRETVARLAQQWAQHQLEILMINKVLERLGSEQSSDLLEHAGEILEQITQGAWVALQIKESGERRTLMVVGADEKRFDTGELSEGTADAVYLALRLAAVARHHRQRVEADRPVFPLVLDDALITLDDPRSSGVLRALSTLADGLQVVVFTHHPHLGYLASEMPGVQVTTIPEPLSKSEDADPAAIRERAKAPLFEAPRRQPQSRDASRKEELQSIREWARGHGYTVGDKGRIPLPVREAYEAAHAL